MKKTLFYTLILALAVACNNGDNTNRNAEAPKDVATAPEASETFRVDPSQSSLKWRGAKRTQTVHMGTVDIKEGSLSFKDGKLAAGNFTADMTSMKNKDLTDPKENQKLMGHLKSGDFFHVDSFPTSRFEITEVKQSGEGTYDISGNLTIKGITHNINFPATVNHSSDKVTAHAKFEIDRNEWDITWGGSKEKDKRITDMLGDNLIKDMIELEVDLVANK